MKKHVLFFFTVLFSVTLLKAQNLQESFEGDEFPPEGWEQTGSGFIQGNSNYSAYEGTGYAYISSGQDTLITPKLTIDDGDFFSLQANSGSGSLQVLISDDKISWTVLQDLVMSYGYQNYTIPLGAEEAGYKYIALAADAGSYYSVYCDSINGPSIYMPPLDAGINSIDQPKGTTSTGSKDVIVTLKNYGSDNLTSVDIEWSVDGVAQSTYSWIGDLAQGASEQVTLGNFNFTSEKDYEISVTTTLPNGGTDENAENDNCTDIVTAIAPITAPFVENFDGVSTPEVPAGWNTIISNNYLTCETVSTAPFSAPNEVKFANSFYSSEDIMLVSKPISNYSNKILKFHARGNGRILAGTMSDNSDAATFTALDSIDVTSDYTQYEIDFSGYGGQDDFIAFRHANLSTYQSIFIDDFRWEEKKANDAEVVSIDQPTASFQANAKDVLVTIKNNGTAALTEVDIEWSVNGTPQTTFNWTGNLASADTEQVNLGSYDFSAGGNFTIEVNSANPNGVADENTTNDTIQSSVYANAPIITPYTEDFDDEAIPALPMGWSKIVNSTSDYAAVETASGISYTGDQAVKLYNAGDASAGLYLVSPPISSFSGNRLKVHIGGVSGGSVSIGTMSDPSDPLTFEEFESITTNSALTEYIINFYNYSGSDNYIAIKHGNAGAYQSVYADHFVWESVPVLSPLGYDFGITSANDTSDVKNFEVTNNNASAMTINSSDVTISGNDAGAFFVDLSEDIDLASGEATNIPVYFVPSSAGKKSADLNITPAKATYSASLTGNAFPENSLIEFFEGESFPPMGWEKPDNYSWVQKEAASIEGTYSAYHSGSEYDVLSTPKLDISDGDSLVFTARNSTYGGSLSIVISSDGKNWTNLKDISVTSTGQEYVVHFTTEDAGQKYIGFEASSYIYLDCITGPVMLEISHDASLSDILLDGESMGNFHPDTLDYEVMLASNASSAPEISVITADSAAEANITQASTVPGFAFIRVTAEDNVTQKDYEVYFDKLSSSDSTLADLKVDGTTIDGFRKDSTNYLVELPYGTTEVPVVDAAPTDTAAEVVINNAAQIPGTTIVEVTSADGEHELFYSIEFKENPAKTLSFSVIDSVTGNSVENAAVLINQSQKIFTDENGQVKMDVSNGVYYYVIDKAGYHTYEDSVIVEGEDENIHIEFMPEFFSLSFIIEDRDGAVENASITVGTKQLKTNSSGHAIMDTIPGDYNYLVEKEGYGQVNGVVSVIDSDVTEVVSLPMNMYTITFKVRETENNQSLEDVVILLESRELITDASGEASIDTIPGVYNVSVQENGYEEYNNAIELNTKDTTCFIELSPEKSTSVGEQFEDANMKVYPNPTNGKFSIQLSQTNVHVEIIDMSGMKVYETVTTQKTEQFDISEFSDGYYIIRIHLSKGLVCRKLIKN